MSTTKLLTMTVVLDDIFQCTQVCTAAHPYSNDSNNLFSYFHLFTTITSTFHVQNRT